MTKMSIADRIAALRAQLPPRVELVAVSKFQPIEKIREAYEAGQRVFAESRAQELAEKQALLPKDIVWHFIGTMQTNKVKHYAPFVSMIQSVDSEKALQVVQKEAHKNGRTIDVLLEVHIAGEASKQGFLPEEIEAYLTADVIRSLPGVRIRGLMGMATFTGETARIEREFALLHALFERLKPRVDAAASGSVFDTLSMGMTDDWRCAVAAGSTMVRIGSFIFGER
jgi:pyridoxal phosphate enzyme (YggS family)